MPSKPMGACVSVLDRGAKQHYEIFPVSITYAGHAAGTGIIVASIVATSSVIFSALTIKSSIIVDVSS